LDHWNWCPQPEQLPAGARLFTVGETVDTICWIVDGLVKFVRATSAGEEMTLGLRTAGSTLGAIGLVRQQCYQAAAIAVLPTTIRRLTASTFLEQLASSDDFWDWAIQAMSCELQSDLHDHLRMSLPTPEQRLIRVLAQFARGARHPDEVRVPRAVGVSDWAGLLDISRDRANEQLMTWRRSGHVRVEADAVVFRYAALRQAGSATAATRPRTVVDRRITEAIARIDREYVNPALDLHHLSHQVNLSRWHFSRLFKCSTGVGFRHYLNVVRLDHAREALRTTPLSVKEIAAAVGYNHVHDLTRRFKYAYGVTPTEYRLRER
jgi:AraC-like DNA-binding protein/CRP-like cAMP-binding protein